MFFAFDRAAERLDLPGAFIHTHMELGGRLDVAGLRRALAALHRVYPVTNSRLERSAVLGRPRWHLDVRPPDLDRVVRVHQLDPANDESLRREIEKLLSARIDPVHLPPLQFHVFTGLDRGDVLVVRWPHALMDGRGGFVIIEEIERLYREKPEPATLASAGDEGRDDFARLVSGKPAVSRLRGRPLRSWVTETRTSSHREPGERDAQLPLAPPLGELGPLRFAVRHLPADEVRQARDVAAHLCPSVRFGAFLRAAAVRALHRLMPQPPRPRTSYSVPYLIEGRDRPYRVPVCRNLFSLERVRVPAALAADRRAVATLLHERTADMLARGPMTRYLASVLRLSRLPTSVLAALVRHSLIAGLPPWQRGDLAEPPSLPMGFIRAFTRAMPTFCGAELRRTYVFRLPLPRVGMGIQVTADHGQLTIGGLCFEAQAAMMRQFLDDFVAALLDAD